MANCGRCGDGHLPASFLHKAPGFRDPRNSGASSTVISRILSSFEVSRNLGIESTEFSKDEIPLTPAQGRQLYSVGFGTGTAWYKEGPEEPLSRDLDDTLKAAIERGFRHIDASDAYGTEEEVGIAIKEYGIPREEIFGLYDIPISIQSSLTKLQLDHVDLYLLHSPYLARKLSGLQAIWLSMEQVKASGKAKSIGVSNHQCSHIEVLLNVASITPAFNQLEFHPYLQRAYDYLPWMRAHGIEVTSFNGLTPIAKARPRLLNNILVEISARHQVPKNAVLISWQIAQNVVVTTTTTKVGRLEDCAAAV